MKRIILMLFFCFLSNLSATPEHATELATQLRTLAEQLENGSPSQATTQQALVLIVDQLTRLLSGTLPYDSNMHRGMITSDLGEVFADMSQNYTVIVDYLKQGGLCLTGLGLFYACARAGFLNAESFSHITPADLFFLAAFLSTEV